MIGDKRNANYCHQSERLARAPLRILKYARRKTSASFVILASIQLALRHLARMKVCKRMSEGTFAGTRGNDDNAPIKPRRQIPIDRHHRRRKLPRGFLPRGFSDACLRTSPHACDWQA